MERPEVTEGMSDSHKDESHNSELFRRENEIISNFQSTNEAGGSSTSYPNTISSSNRYKGKHGRENQQHSNYGNEESVRSKSRESSSASKSRGRSKNHGGQQFGSAVRRATSNNNYYYEAEINSHRDFAHTPHKSQQHHHHGVVHHSSNEEQEKSRGDVVNGRYVKRSNSIHSSMDPAHSTEYQPSNSSAGYSQKGNSMFSNYSGARQKNGHRQNLHRPNYHEQNGRTFDYPERKFYASHEAHHEHQKPKYHNKSSSRNKKPHRNENLISQDELYLQGGTQTECWDAEEIPLPSANNFKLKKGNKNQMDAFDKPSAKESTTQRDRLIKELESGQYECMVCCENIRRGTAVWCCCNCYHIFHMKCIRRWARSASVQDGGWRCPGCQKLTEQVPCDYFCFCGKKKDPEVNHHYTPHSCGELCGKQRDDEKCIHRCNLLCHPGPCPPCSATISKSCECGKTQKVVPCAQSDAVICSSTCDKLLNCGVHQCLELCHVGSCQLCAVSIKQECYCKHLERKVLCDRSTVGQSYYSCGATCGKTLSCGHHNCPMICHQGSCTSCSLLPGAVSTCPCGKTSLKELYASGETAVRKSCVDPIPVCLKKCEKTLPCGPKNNHHKCCSGCHLEECQPCSLVTIVKCQCGSTQKEVPCKDMTFPYEFYCEKRCNRRKDCGRHKCLNHCCVLTVHKCELVCNKKLSCGSHHCQNKCHGGNCHTCLNASFDELRCHCGHSVLYPPIPCGTRPPDCEEPCTRSHSCGHKVQHSCHSDQKCPPCTVLVEKWCFGHHEKRTVQCVLDGISCGKRCEKELQCGKHKCQNVCHMGPCLKPDANCMQPCVLLRTCNHPCDAPCHSGPCPETPCKAMVTISCPCSYRTEKSTCSSEDSSTYRMMSVSVLATKIHDIKLGDSVNISDILGKKGKFRLQCNEDCAIHKRNKQLALALQIRNPDLSCKPGPPNYSEFLKEEARKNIKFVAFVYDKFNELVQLAKQSKQKSRSYAFNPMNRDQRRIIHELAEFFGCETQSYDEEPMKNVVITAFRDRSWLPFVSILTVVEREMGLRRGPAPVISTPKVPVQVSIAEKKTKAIDYFDFVG